MDSVDREPQPSDGPDYHAEHAYWVARQPKVGDETDHNWRMFCALMGCSE